MLFLRAKIILQLRVKKILRFPSRSAVHESGSSDLKMVKFDAHALTWLSSLAGHSFVPGDRVLKHGSGDPELFCV